MPTTITVRCDPGRSGWTCTVILEEGATSTTHAVSVTHADLARLAPDAASPEDLVRRSFVFLLRREPKESILRRFDLPVIGRYFPEWEAEVRQG